NLWRESEKSVEVMGPFLWWTPWPRLAEFHSQWIC
ncbi:unnamed protein product, partial [Allacma fusca]